MNGLLQKTFHSGGFFYLLSWRYVCEILGMNIIKINTIFESIIIPSKLLLCIVEISGNYVENIA